MLTYNIVMSKCEIIMLIYDFNYVVCVNLIISHVACRGAEVCHHNGSVSRYDNKAVLTWFELFVPVRHLLPALEFFLEEHVLCRFSVIV